jgi:hypothetical protein
MKVKSQLAKNKKIDKFSRDFADTLYGMIDSSMNDFVDKYSNRSKRKTPEGGRH